MSLVDAIEFEFEHGLKSGSRIRIDERVDCSIARLSPK